VPSCRVFAVICSDVRLAVILLGRLLEEQEPKLDVEQGKTLAWRVRWLGGHGEAVPPRTDGAGRMSTANSDHPFCAAAVTPRPGPDTLTFHLRSLSRDS
jgi:hypothetical protein